MEDALSRGADPDNTTMAQISLMVYFTSEVEAEILEDGETVQEAVCD